MPRNRTYYSELLQATIAEYDGAGPEREEVEREVIADSLRMDGWRPLPVRASGAGTWPMTWPEGRGSAVMKAYLDFNLAEFQRFGPGDPRSQMDMAHYWTITMPQITPEIAHLYELDGARNVLPWIQKTHRGYLQGLAHLRIVARAQGGETHEIKMWWRMPRFLDFLAIARGTRHIVLTDDRLYPRRALTDDYPAVYLELDHDDPQLDALLGTYRILGFQPPEGEARTVRIRGVT